MSWTRTTKGKLLLSTAILVASFSVASAQGMREGREGGAGGMGRGGGHQPAPHGSLGPSGNNDRGGGSMRDVPGRAAEHGDLRGQVGRSETTGRGPRQDEAPRVNRSTRAASGPSRERTGMERDHLRTTNGRAARNEERGRPKAGHSHTVGQERTRGGHHATHTATGEDRSASRANGVAENGRSATNTIRTTKGHMITAQQRTTIRNSVLSGKNVPRARNVNFAIRSGVFVPDTVSFVSVSDYPELLDVFPYYRGDSFFVAEDEIVFVGSDRRIVDVVPFGSAYAEGSSETVHAWRGHDYCFYFDGWNGPGWYRCGWAWRSGYGFGGFYGWNDWYYGPAFARFGRRFYEEREYSHNTDHDRRYGNEIRDRDHVNGIRERGEGRIGEHETDRLRTRETTGAGPREDFDEERNRGPEARGLGQGPMRNAGPRGPSAFGGGAGGGGQRIGHGEGGGHGRH